MRNRASAARRAVRISADCDTDNPVGSTAKTALASVISVAISSTAAAFCSRFIGLLRRASRCAGGLWWPRRWRLRSGGRGGRLLEDVAGAGGVDLHARTHRRRDGDRADVATLGGGRLGADDLVDHGRVVLQKRARLEAGLADVEMDDRGAVGAVLDLAGLGLLDGLGDVHRHGADLRVGHLALRAEDPAELADHGHHVRRRDRDVEVREAVLDLLGQVLGADDVGPGLLGLARLVALGEDGDRHALAQAVGQRDRAAQLLIGVAHVQAGADVELDGLVEARPLELLDERHCLRRRVVVLAVDLLARLDVLATVPGHQTTSTPIERAVPAMIFAAWSMSWALRSGSFFSAIART